MKRFFIIALIVGGIWFLHRTNPTFNDHRIVIAPRSSVADPRWKDLQYKNYLLLSFTRSDTKKTMVSFGVATHVIVMDEDWFSWNI